MIKDRVEQMIQELAMNMEGRGSKLDDYLKFSNKTIEDLRSAQGIKRYWLLMSLAHFMCAVGTGRFCSFETGYHEICDTYAASGRTLD